MWEIHQRRLYLCKRNYTPKTQGGCNQGKNRAELLVVQRVKSLPAVQEMLVQSLSQENPLEEGEATHCSLLAWRVPWTEEPRGLQSTGSQTVGQDWATNAHKDVKLKSLINFKSALILFYISAMTTLTKGIFYLSLSFLLTTQSLIF